MDNIKIISQNKKAFHDYFVLEQIECGIELKGTEIKSIRLGKVSINEAYCLIKNHEIFVEGMHISKYEQGNIFNHDPLRLKRLLLHKREIHKLENRVILDGYSLIPLQVYLSKGRCKVKIALCKGKKMYDKREDLKNKAIDREEKNDYKNEY